MSTSILFFSENKLANTKNPSQKLSEPLFRQNIKNVKYDNINPLKDCQIFSLMPIPEYDKAKQDAFIKKLEEQGIYRPLSFGK